jgi:histidyl-tRNA synthetase
VLVYRSAWSAFIPFLVHEGPGRGQCQSSPRNADVYVVAAGSGGFLLERMAICGQLTRVGIRAAFSRKAKPSLRSQFSMAEKAPLTVILGTDEISAGTVRLKASSGKTTKSNAGEKDFGRLVVKDDLVMEVKKEWQGLVGYVGSDR